MTRPKSLVSYIVLHTFYTPPGSPSAASPYLISFYMLALPAIMLAPMAPTAIMLAPIVIITLAPTAMMIAGAPGRLSGAAPVAAPRAEASGGGSVGGFQASGGGGSAGGTEPASAAGAAECGPKPPHVPAGRTVRICKFWRGGYCRNGPSCVDVHPGVAQPPRPVVGEEMENACVGVPAPPVSPPSPSDCDAQQVRPPSSSSISSAVGPQPRPPTGPPPADFSAAVPPRGTLRPP